MADSYVHATRRSSAVPRHDVHVHVEFRATKSLGMLQMLPGHSGKLGMLQRLPGHSGKQFTSAHEHVGHKQNIP